MWSEIKVKHHWLEGPNHILKQLSLVHAMDPAVIDIVMPYVRSSAWNAHAESVLQTMLTSEDSSQREFSVNTILKICKCAEFGDSSVRVCRVPPN